jgi:hypothetical protein
MLIMLDAQEKARNGIRAGRTEISVVDCTIRDGGLMNQSRFTLDCVQAVYQAVCAAGVQVVELGYRNSRKLFDPATFGPWRFCDDQMIERVVGDHKHPGTRIAVMMDAHKCEVDDLKPRERSPVDLVRCATYLDATLYGLGRGAGNCNLELLLGYLDRPGYDPRIIYDVIASHILPLQKEISWGYAVPYQVTGILNCQQDEGMRLQALAAGDPARTAFRAFYDRMRGGAQTAEAGTIRPAQVG